MAEIYDLVIEQKGSGRSARKAQVGDLFRADASPPSADDSLPRAAASLPSADAIREKGMSQIFDSARDNWMKPIEGFCKGVMSVMEKVTDEVTIMRGDDAIADHCATLDKQAKELEARNQDDGAHLLYLREASVAARGHGGVLSPQFLESARHCPELLQALAAGAARQPMEIPPAPGVSKPDDGERTLIERLRSPARFDFSRQQ